MKTLFRRFAFALALFSLTGVALAAPHDNHHSNQRKVVYVDAGHHYSQPNYNRNNYRNADRYNRTAYQQRYPSYYRSAPQYDARWQRGHRYTGPVYVVRDYGHYHLRTPPRGSHWVRTDNRYLLVAIATGIIMDIAMH